MNTKSRSRLIDDIATIYRHARENCDGECCMVAPHPDLQAKLKQDLAQLRGTAAGHMANLLRVKDRTSPGLNDGLIYPGDLYPLGTPLRIARAGAADRTPLRGTVRVVVVLAQFSDRTLGASHTQQHFQDLFFSTGVLPQGSVKEYYREVTNNLVNIEGEVVGPYQMPMTLAQYANGASGTGSTSPNARTMARDAAEASNSDVNFAPYDNDGNGYVDAFIVIHAGQGAEVTGSANDIWSHKWVLSGGAYNADGTQIYAYLTVPEDAKIGVCCHELGHLLFGFPDLYDTDYSSEGVGNWCLMGGGSWNGGGDVPSHPSAWCKANQGWVSVVNQTTNANVSINDVKAGHQVHRLWKDGASGSEYFLVENRQRTLYDRELPGGGLLIWHVDESISSNSDENHPKVALKQADGQRDLTLGNNRGDAGDPYPGSAGNTTFNATSTPDSKSYAGADTCVAVTNIGASGPVVTARLSVKCMIKAKEFKEFKELAKDNLKELRKEIAEKYRRKETKDIKEFKEREKPIKEKDKDAEKPGEWGGGGFGFAPPEQGTCGTGDIETRVAALEARLAEIEPFIDAGLRPDLRQSALSAEEDLQDLNTRMQERAANAKRYYDTVR
jgi:immune inhibitor A